MEDHPDIPGTGGAPAPRRFHLALAAVLALGLAGVAGLWRDGRPVPLPDVPAGRLACLSYTPRMEGEDPVAGASPARITADLTLLAAETRCVRTYSSTLGMDAVPGIARGLGLSVLQGIWIGADAAANEREIAAALAVANRHPDVVRGIVVGNEVLLRHEQTPEAMAAYLMRVNAATDIPVTYADVWEFWRRHRALAAHADFITLHILPYWENDPVHVTAALDHVRDVYALMQAQFPGRRLVIGETGWPTQGRQREGAAPGRVNSARFVREFVAWAHAQGIDYNIIEAFDQPWKRANEGTVGGFWGLYDVAGRPKFPLQGAVTEDAGWRTGLGLALALALAGVVVGARAGRRGAAWLGALGLVAGVALYAQWRYVPASSRDLLEWALALGGVATGWVLVALLGRPAAWTDAGQGVAALPGAVTAWRRGDLATAVRTVAVLRLVLLFGLAYLCLGFALDARYRDFPLAITLLPALLLTLRQAFGVAGDRVGSEERMLAAIILAAGAASLFIEGVANATALAWNASCVLLALSTLRVGAEPAQHQRR